MTIIPEMVYLMAHGKGFVDRDVVIKKKVPGLATRHLQLMEIKCVIIIPCHHKMAGDLHVLYFTVLISWILLNQGIL